MIPFSFKSELSYSRGMKKIFIRYDSGPWVPGTDHRPACRAVAPVLRSLGEGGSSRKADSHPIKVNQTSFLSHGADHWLVSIIDRHAG
jgi:hypothetical protein